VVGLGSLLAASDRLMRRVLSYRGAVYTATLGILLAALPLLPFLEQQASAPDIFFIVAALTLGLLLRTASVHINRFFFHRDRVGGIERPVHWLPFALLVLIYGASLSSLQAFATHLALPLAFIALALIDSGEEYYRALTEALGHRPKPWPRRSLALLALGFAGLVAAVLVAPLDTGHASLAIVATLAAWRLLAWAGRFDSVPAHVGGLLAGIVAFHASPALIPDGIRRLFERMVTALGLDPHHPATVSFADLWIVAALLAFAWARRAHWPRPIARAHAGVVALHASITLLISLQDLAAARLVAPICALLLLAGLSVTRWKLLIPVLYQALVTLVLAFTRLSADPEIWWSARSAWLLGLVNLLFLGAGLVALKRSEGASRQSLATLLAWPPMAISLLFVPQALVWLGDRSALSGLVFFVIAETFLLGALALRRAWAFPVAGLALVAGSLCLADALPGTALPALSLVSQGLMVAGWLVYQRLERKPPEGLPTGIARGWQLGAQVVAIVSAACGLLWVLIASTVGPGIEPFHLVLLGGILIVEAIRDRQLAQPMAGTTGYATAGSGWQLEAGLALLVLWAPIQSAAVAGTQASWMFVATSWLVLAIGARIAAEAIERRFGTPGQSIDGSRALASRLAFPFLVMAVVCAAGGGAVALYATEFGGSPWLPILPAFLASLFFVFLAAHGHFKKFSAGLATVYFIAASTVLLSQLKTFGPELYCLGPGLALLGLSTLLRDELDSVWRQRLFTGGAACLYAMPVMGLLEELSWGWQIVLLLLAIGFGAASFKLRSRSLLIVSTAALVINLTCFLIRLRQTEPLLLWVAGIVFGLGLMAVAGLLEHRRERLLQHIRIWGNELRSWA
ncbi:MAG: hypothetical protein AAF657_38450, partial [Acidobacteriota bacterium]